MQMMAWAEQQAIVGVIYGGIQRAGQELGVPFDALMEWIGYAQQIENQNRILNEKCVEVVNEYQEAGYGCMVLKGQGNAVMYPSPLLRMSGDIDIWSLSPDPPSPKRVGRLRNDIIQYVKNKHADSETRYYHVEYTDVDVPVEAHFMPGVMNNPVYNRRLQQWYEEKADSGWLMAELPEGAGRIPVPTWEFNVVFQLAHMMHHFFDEGIGLRQFVDYYYLLRQEQNIKIEKLKSLSCTLKYLGLMEFAGAVMFIEKEVLGLDEKYLIVEPDEKRGRTLLREIMEGGNFGRSGHLDQHSAAKKYFQKTWRNLRLAKEYPAEALCEPLFRTWHFFWRLTH